MRTDKQLYDLGINTNCFRALDKIDQSKVTRRRQGERTTQPGSNYGKVMWELGYRAWQQENPTPLPKPPPVVVSTIDPVWKLDAAFSEGGLSNFSGPPRQRAFQLGWRAVYVQLMHTEYTDANLEEMSAFAREGWTIIGWGTYGQGSEPFADGRQAGFMCKEYGLKGWKANGEAWAEQEYQWKTRSFLDGWRMEGAPVPLGWSVLSSDTANYAREFDYGTALSVTGADIDIQVYGSTYPSYTVGAGLGMLAKANVPVSRTAMSFDINNEGIGPFADYRTWAGPRRLWACDKATIATFEALER